MLGEDIVNRRVERERKAARNAEAKSNRARLKGLYGYLPVAKRKKCPWCTAPLPLYPYISGRALYGYKGEGHFCRLYCAYKYAVYLLTGRRN